MPKPALPAVGAAAPGAVGAPDEAAGPREDGRQAARLPGSRHIFSRQGEGAQLHTGCVSLPARLHQLRLPPQAVPHKLLQVLERANGSTCGAHGSEKQRGMGTAARRERGFMQVHR